MFARPTARRIPRSRISTASGTSTSRQKSLITVSTIKPNKTKAVNDHSFAVRSTSFRDGPEAKGSACPDAERDDLDAAVLGFFPLGRFDDSAEGGVERLR